MTANSSFFDGLEPYFEYMKFEIDPTAPESIVRRSFIKKLAFASARPGYRGAKTGWAGLKLPPQSRCCSGWAEEWQPRSFDPKRYAPFERNGVSSVLSTFAIDTVVDDIKIALGWRTSPVSWIAVH